MRLICVDYIHVSFCPLASSCGEANGVSTRDQRGEGITSGYLFSWLPLSVVTWAGYVWQPKATALLKVALVTQCASSGFQDLLLHLHPSDPCTAWGPALFLVVSLCRVHNLRQQSRH